MCRRGTSSSYWDRPQKHRGFWPYTIHVRLSSAGSVPSFGFSDATILCADPSFRNRSHRILGLISPFLSHCRRGRPFVAPPLSVPERFPFAFPFVGDFPSDPLPFVLPSKRLATVVRPTGASPTSVCVARAAVARGRGATAALQAPIGRLWIDREAKKAKERPWTSSCASNRRNRGERGPTKRTKQPREGHAVGTAVNRRGERGTQRHACCG